jgi:branched-chain amino acid transport system permease protein
MYASNYGTVQHTMGFCLPEAFTAAVFGGIGLWAVLGRILLGLIESMARATSAR